MNPAGRGPRYAFNLKLIALASFGLTAALVVPSARAADAPASSTPFTKTAVLALAERVADWQLANPSTDHPAHWTQGAGYTGMMALASISSSPRFSEAMLKMAQANQWQLGARIYHADDHVVGQTYVDLYLKQRDPRMLAPMRERFDFIIAHPKDDNLDFDGNKNPDALDRWSWCDALFMAPAAWLRLYGATGEKAYLDYMVRNWWVTTEYLYDKEEHLYFRDSSYFQRREANGKKVFWSRGNGWVLAGLARVLQDLPSDHPSRPRFVQLYRDMAEKILSLQQSDGLWRSSLLDPENYPLKESSGSAFYCFALAWGVNNHLLERGRYEPAIKKAWDGLSSCVTAEGKLTHVQPIGADPKRFPDDFTAVYGVGAFLLAASEVFKLVQ
jgi:unsaturated rhamnogalacturonyl hydrolase